MEEIVIFFGFAFILLSVCKMITAWREQKGCGARPCPARAILLPQASPGATSGPKNCRVVAKTGHFRYWWSSDWTTSSTLRREIQLLRAVEVRETSQILGRLPQKWLKMRETSHFAGRLPHFILSVLSASGRGSGRVSRGRRARWSSCGRPARSPDSRT